MNSRDMPDRQDDSQAMNPRDLSDLDDHSEHYEKSIPTDFRKGA